MSLLYGRKWRLLVSRNGVDCLDVSQLDITFDISKTMGDDGNSGQITVFNLSRNSIRGYIDIGSRVILEAGYDGGPYGVIFDGDVIDKQEYKEDGVTRVLDMVAKDGDVFLTGTFMNGSYKAGMSTTDLLAQFEGAGGSGIALGTISPGINTTQLSRGRALYGPPGDILEGMARSNGGIFYINDRTINIVRADDPPAGQVVSITPTSGLIGSPTQTEDGIEFKCLLNPILNLNKLVHVSSQYVKRSMASGDSQAMAPLEGDGIYKIIKIKHTGATKENEWYTEGIGIAQPGLYPVGYHNFVN